MSRSCYRYFCCERKCLELIFTMFSRRSAIILILLLPISWSVRVESKQSFVRDLGFLAEAVGNLIQVADDCKYQCPNGATPMKNPAHKPSADGCGSYGAHFEIDAVPGATSCCNEHDYCYDECNSDKAVCDDQLKRCLAKICYELEGVIPRQEVDECETTVRYIFGGVSTLGCDAYKKAQESACLCT